ncbi:Squalene epoxidase [Marasmius crinis-equi]|uniref:Squalene monooxygenase n=1 Tax=Marasmius crinis-equi TaxID=585013 RepID=A0ABR3FGF4_9AGAR
MHSPPYDVLIVGAGIVGCSLAHALSTLPRQKPLRIALLERSMEEPDRIVGELLQPGGVMALQKLGMESCLEDIDAIPVKGYYVVNGGQSVHIPYPDRHVGSSFHHGKFIMNLRAAAKRAKGVDVIEATVTELMECDGSGRIVGVAATRKTGQDNEVEKISFRADLVVVADGCFSNFRTQVMDRRALKPVVKSHFIGVVLEDARLPMPHHGTVCLTETNGPALLYQIGTRETRMLIDVKNPLPSDMKSHLINNVIPELPSSVHLSALQAVKKDRLRRMPNSFLPPVEQGHSKQGVILLGDAWNMRHPLTGGGMTVGFNDVVILRDLLRDVEDFSDWEAMKGVLHRLHWRRKPLASAVNILSVALYDLFGANDENLTVLRDGCFKYFERGGACVEDPVSLLSGIVPSPTLLIYHFFSVAFYAVWCMFTHARPVRLRKDDKPKMIAPSVAEYPYLALKSVAVIYTAAVVVLPLVWTEIRWWSPEQKSARHRPLFMILMGCMTLCYLFL